MSLPGAVLGMHRLPAAQKAPAWCLPWPACGSPRTSAQLVCGRGAGKSNSGEGGEDPLRWEHLGDVDTEGNSPSFPHLKGLQVGHLLLQA